jgi:NAD(P)-dependent dehydrogenase (short-subunit alcohol dehydrogenase family)
MRTNLKEKVALVTGASSGLGDRFARVLAANGALVVLAARRMDRLKELRAQIESAGGAAHAVSLDVTDHDAIKAAIDEVGSTVGPIDILVNNSGVSTVQRLTEVEAADFDYVFNTNVRGSFFVAQAVARQMIGRARDTPNFRGRIVNIASVAGLRVLPQIGVYCMSKAAVVHMTRAQALEWGRYGINVNAICPGYVRTEINAEHWETEAGRKLVQMLPRRRIGEAADLDGTLLLLVAEESQFINGAVIAVDDGMSVT